MNLILKNILATRLIFLFFVIFSLGNSSTTWAQGVPGKQAFQGYVTDNAGNPPPSPATMRFGLYVDGIRYWYAEYTSVIISSTSAPAGRFSVFLGDTVQGGQSLNPLSGTSILNTNLPLSSSLLNTVSTSSSVEIEVQVLVGASYETLSPRTTIGTALFALMSDNSRKVGGYSATQLVKFDGTGQIISYNGTAIIDSLGNWIGPAVTGAIGPAGATGAAGAAGAVGPTGPAGPSIVTNTVLLNTGKIWIGSANIAQEQTMNGDAVISNTGLLTISNNAITNAKINDVAFSKITSKPTTISGYGITDGLSSATVFSGDISGTQTSINVNKLKGQSLNITALASNHILQYNGTDYVNRAIPTCSTGEYITFNGTTWSCATDTTGGGTVASVTGTLPIVVIGATTPVVSMAKASTGADGYLASSDFTTFSNKLSNNLTSTNIFVGNASNGAQARVLSGDATIDNAGILTINNNAVTNAKISSLVWSKLTGVPTTAAGFGITDTLTTSTNFSGDLSGPYNALALSPTGVGAGTYSKVTVNLKGRITAASNIGSTDVTAALGYTPSSNALSNANIFIGNGSNLAQGQILSGDATINSSGILTINTNAITNAKINDVAFSKLTGKPTTLFGHGITMTSSDVTGALGYTPGSGGGTVGTVTASTTAGNPITISNSSTSPSVDISRATASVNGYLASSDFSIFNNKLSASLNSANIFVGNASNIAQAQVLSGDATISNIGLLTISNNAITNIKINDMAFSKLTGKPTTLFGHGITMTSSDVTGALGFTPGTGAGTVGTVTASTTVGNPITISNSSTSPSVDISRATASVNGYLASSDFSIFNNKLSASLNSANIFIGNASNIAQAQVLSGDATLSNTGLITLSNSGVGAGTYSKVSVDTKGRVTSATTVNSGDVTAALTFTPVPNTLSSASIFVGNASNIAQAQVLSGDATLSNTGLLTLNTVPITKGGTGGITKTAAFDNLGPSTTKGDLIVHNGTNNVRVPAGANSQTLIADSTQASGVKWINNGIVDRNFTSVAVTNTIVETAVYTYTMPAGMLGTQSGVRLNLIGTYLNNSGTTKTVRLRIKYGTAILFDDTSLAFATGSTTRAYNLNFDLFNTGTTSSQKLGGFSSFSNFTAPTAGVGDFTTTNVLNSIIYGSAVTDSTVSQVLTVTIIHSGAAATVTMTNLMATLQFLY